MEDLKADLHSLNRTPIDTAVASSDPMSDLERLFMDAGLNYIQYQRWRLLSLPSLKTMAALERLHHGWPIESFDDEASELRLAKIWLETNAPRAAADRERKAVESSPAADPRYGPLMTSSEAQKLIQQGDRGREACVPQSLRERSQAGSRDSQGHP
jgi:hypothetical protein